MDYLLQKYSHSIILRNEKDRLIERFEISLQIAQQMFRIGGVFDSFSSAES